MSWHPLFYKAFTTAILLCFATAGAFANNSNGLAAKVCETKLLPGPQPWRELRAMLGAQLKNPAAEIAKLLVTAESVGTIHGNLGSGVVGVVFEVRTPRGPMALKMFTTGSLEHFSRAILMQRLLGLLGVAPQVNGVLSQAQAQRLIMADKAFAGRVSPQLIQFALLMDKVDGISIKEITPESSSEHGWKFERVTDEIRAIERVLGQLRILPEDGQVLITPSSHVQLHDLDFYKWVSDDGHAYSYDEEGSVAPGLARDQPFEVDLRLLPSRH